MACFKIRTLVCGTVIGSHYSSSVQELSVQLGCQTCHLFFVATKWHTYSGCTRCFGSTGRSRLKSEKEESHRLSICCLERPCDKSNLIRDASDCQCEFDL